MTDKIHKIKDWISKEQDGLMDTNGNFECPEHEEAYHILCNLDAYIDSLQEEPVKIDRHISKMADEFAEREYETNGYERQWLSKGYYHGYMDAGKGKLKEPVSENLEEACEQLAENARKHKAETVSPFFSQTDYRQGVIDGAQWQKEHLWKPADGDDLPEIDREVIAILNNGKVMLAHRPPEYWDDKDIVTGKVTRYYPKTYDKGGWNIPDVKFWLDVELPKEIEL